MNPKIEIGEAVSRVENSVPDVDKRVVRRLEAGVHVVHQGDVYLHRVSDDHPRGEQIGKGLVQIALGTGSGARHMAEGDVEVFKGTTFPKGFRVPEWIDPAQMLGPVVVAKSRWNLPHPEHPHHELPAGTYQTTYQADWMTQRRVAD